jgi:hypothetical protein
MSFLAGVIRPGNGFGSSSSSGNQATDESSHMNCTKS